jgi:hypothetical protein
MGDAFCVACMAAFLTRLVICKELGYAVRIPKVLNRCRENCVRNLLLSTTVYLGGEPCRINGARHVQAADN